MAEGKAVATRNSEVVLYDSNSHEGLETLQEILSTGVLPNTVHVIEDPEAVTKQIAQRILSSDSWETPEATGWSERVGIPYEVHGFRWIPSAYDKGSAVFMVVDAVNMQDKHKEILTTGAFTVLCQLTVMAKNNLFPVQVQLQESDRETKSGFRPHKLVPVTEEQTKLAESLASDDIPF